MKSKKVSSDSSIRYVATQMDELDKEVIISQIMSALKFMKAMPFQEFMEEYYLYFHDSRMVISSETVYLDWESSHAFFQYLKF